MDFSNAENENIFLQRKMNKEWWMDPKWQQEMTPNILLEPEISTVIKDKRIYFMKIKLIMPTQIFFIVSLQPEKKNIFRKTFHSLLTWTSIFAIKVETSNYIFKNDALVIMYFKYESWCLIRSYDCNISLH